MTTAELKKKKDDILITIHRKIQKVSNANRNSSGKTVSNQHREESSPGGEKKDDTKKIVAESRKVRTHLIVSTT